MSRPDRTTPLALHAVPAAARARPASGSPRGRFVLAACLVLAGCQASRAPVDHTPPVPVVPVGPRGLGAVIGQTPEVVLQRFAPASLDRVDGPVRLLQFRRAGCIFDVYFYADRGTGRPTGRHAEARLPDGRPTDVTGCIDRQLDMLAPPPGP